MLSSTQPLVRLAQISDLHFIKELTEKGRMHFLKQFLSKSHAFGKIEALGDQFRIIENPSWEKSIEVLIATGDISTDGSTEALETALDFIASDKINDSTGKLITHGLGKRSDRRLVLPGNHDRFTATWRPRQVSSTELEDVFTTSKKYPYVVGYRPADFISNSDPALLFFIFDSTLDPKTAARWWNRVARGRIEDADLSEMLNLIAEIKNTGQVKSVAGGSLDVDWNNTFRIAVLHHHPITQPGSHRTLLSTTTKMENARLFIRYCFVAGIDLILFGHQHQEYSDKLRPGSYLGWQASGSEHAIYYFCSYSTSEYSEKVNGFYLIDFYRNDFKVIPYHWNGGSFVGQAKISCPYQRTTGFATIP